MLTLMSTMLSSTVLGLHTDGAPVAEWHVGKVVLSYFLRKAADSVLMATAKMLQGVPPFFDGDVACEDARQF